MSVAWLDEIKWDGDGLVPVIAQEATSGEVMMFAWMNRDSLQETLQTGNAVYWSRSRQKLWRKGEESGYQQHVKAAHLDCDGDVIVLKIEQQGGIACHTGRRSCFYRQWQAGQWVEVASVLKDPAEIYSKNGTRES